MDGYISRPIEPQQLTSAVEHLEKDVVNWDEVFAMLGDDFRMVRDCACIALEEFPRLMARVRTGIDRDDAWELYRAAHSLKGMGRLFYCKTVFNAAFELERMGLSKDITQAEVAFAELSGSVPNLLEELVSFLRRTAD